MRSAVILAGGSSRHLGYDKGLRALAGKPLVSYAVDALRPLVDEVILVVGSDAQRISYHSSLPTSVKISVDLYPGGSPLVRARDSPVRNFPGNSDKKYGYLVLTKKKLVFVHEKGLFSKSYDVVWDIPYNGLKEFKQSDKYKIEFNGGDKKYVIETGELNPKIVLNAIQHTNGSH